MWCPVCNVEKTGGKYCRCGALLQKEPPPPTKADHGVVRAATGIHPRRAGAAAAAPKPSAATTVAAPASASTLPPAPIPALTPTLTASTGSPASGSPAPSGALPPPVIPTPGSAGAPVVAAVAPETPAVILQRKNEAIKREIDALNTTIAGKSVPEKAAFAAAAVVRVNGMTADNLALLSAQEQIKLLATLKCSMVGGALPGPQTAALAKVYSAIRLDKDFRDHDAPLRTQVLASVVGDPIMQNAQRTWATSGPLASNAAKKAAVKKAQDLQVAALRVASPGFTPDPIVYDLLTDGSSGFCRGKQVTMSTEPDKSAEFNDTLDTIIHETTHAYQRFLVEELDAGRMTVADPRYAQTWLFKLNDEAYAKSPAKLTAAEKLVPAKKTKYDIDYAAYKRQPVEEHAWKAGNEAGRAFDVNAAALQIADIISKVTTNLPAKSAEAAALGVQMQARASVMEGTEILAQIDELATEAYKAALRTVLALLPDMDQYVAGGFARYDADSQRIQGLKVSPRAKLDQMNRLARTLEPINAQGQLDTAAYDLAATAANTLYLDMDTYVAGGRALYSAQWKAITESAAIASVMRREMTTLKETLERLTAAGRADVDAFELAKNAAGALYPGIGTYAPGGFELYSAEWVRIANSKAVISVRRREMTTLQQTLERLTAAGKIDLAAYNALWAKLACRTGEAAAVNTIDKNERLSPGQKLAALKLTPAGARAAL